MPVPLWQRLSDLYRKEIWQPRHLGDKSLRGRLYAITRVISITLTGIVEANSASRAAALSFSTLLGLGPLVAVAMLVSGFMLDQKDPDLAAKTLGNIIEKIAPQIRQLDNDNDGHLAPAPEAGAANVVSAASQASGTRDGSPELAEMLDGFIAKSRSSAVGTLGAITLIVIVLQLFTSVETSFNEIWGVRRGRSWIMRIVLYWTVLTLGAVLFFAALTGLSVGTVFNAFEARLPYGTEVVATLKFFLPAGSLVVLVGMLTLFYRSIPNTHVWWRAALIGAVVVAALLVLNNVLAFLYLKRVVLQKSLYGSLGILPILMFGLYVFWFFVLLGGQVSYAVQNVNFRNSQAAWGSLAESMRERLSLIVLLMIGRRFQACMAPCTALDLSTRLKVPTQILNESINRLVLMNLVTPVPPSPDNDSTDFRYQPARPLNRISLGDFKRLDDEFGDDPHGPLLPALDPILHHYNEAIENLGRTELFSKSLDELFNEYPAAIV